MSENQSSCNDIRTAAGDASPQRHMCRSTEAATERCRDAQTAMRIVQGPRDNLEDRASAIHVSSCASHSRAYVLLVVCDGAGGEKCGDVASTIGNASLCAEVTRGLWDVEQAEGQKHANTTITKILRTAMLNANRSVLDRSEHDTSCGGMASTATLGIIRDGWLHVTWVGDSRCYVIRDSVAQQITEDHTEVAVLVEAGLLTHEEAVSHPLAHTITQYLGKRHGFSPGQRCVELADDDLVLLCTDGLTDVLTPGDISASAQACVTGECAMEELPQRLINKALAYGTRDNVTALCHVHHQSDHEPAMRKPTRMYTDYREIAKACSQLSKEQNDA